MSSTVAKLPTPVQAPPKPFGPGAMVWDDFGDNLAMALSAGAFVLQAMHPTVSAAVDKQSVFRTDPRGRAVRSFDSVMLWVYGGEEAVQEGRRLRRLHKSIRGRADDGTPYSALNREAYAWVHATAFASAVVAAPYVRGRRLTDAEQDQLYDEMLQLGDILDIRRDDMPADRHVYWDYFDAMVEQRLERTKVADELMRGMHTVDLPLPWPVKQLLWPQRRAAGHLVRLLTLGGMPANSRRKLGEDWTVLHEAQLQTLMGLIRPIHQRLPEEHRYAKLAYHARGHARQLERIKRRATPAV